MVVMLRVNSEELIESQSLRKFHPRGNKWTKMNFKNEIWSQAIEAHSFNPNTQEVVVSKSL